MPAPTPPDPGTASPPPLRHRAQVGVGWKVAAGVLVATGALALLVVLVWGRPQPVISADPFPLTPISESPFLNTGPEAHYVGSDACRSCHEDRHASFRHTGMGRSMTLLRQQDLSSEPPDATFDHPISDRRYQVRRANGQMWHRELLLPTGAKGEEEVLLAEYPMKYVIGSGRHSRTYAAEAEGGFLVESPVTWYRSRTAWGMSPGYDTPHQVGFELAVGDGCLICHAGHASPVGGSLHRMAVREAAIGCERCHGPGSLHQQRHASAGREGPRGRPAGATGGRGEADYTIVNPSRLSRDLAEAICQQCHLRASATLPARGRAPADFRPGLPLQDFREDYVLIRSDRDPGMTVTGHVDQMHRSRCYQRSDTLTCVTCHDPHEPITMAGTEPALKARSIAHYRAVCQGCHQRPDQRRCRVAPRALRAQRPDNSCYHCHMPTAPTDIVHIAFTHHRIGIHRPRQSGVDASPPGSEGGGPAELRPFLALPRQMSDIDRRRSLGLGYLEVANREKAAEARERYQGRALELLAGVKKEGMRDPVMDASLARLLFGLRYDGYGELARGPAVDEDGVEGQSRTTALYLLAHEQMELGRPAEARATLRQLVKLRRHSADWYLLARAENALGETMGEVEALRQVVRINPRRWEVHEHLARLLAQQGNRELAAWHQRRAVPPRGATPGGGGKAE